MPTTVFSNFTGSGDGGLIPVGSNGFVPRGVSINSSGSNGIIGNSSHILQVLGNVFGDSSGVSLGLIAGNQSEKVFVYRDANIGSSVNALQLFGNRNSVVNYGQIIGDAAGVLALNNFGAGRVRISNYGEISGNFVAIDIRGELSLDLNNFGNIDSGIDNVAIQSSGPLSSSVYNTGSIVGDINLAIDDDRLINRGAINGDVRLSNGNDYLDNRGGTIDGLISLGAGDDTFRPGAGFEFADGGGGVDTLGFYGSNGVQLALDDSIVATGVAKDDQYFDFRNIDGSNGNDVFVGDGQNNELDGLKGADKLSGQAADDKLKGGDGNDTLLGGLGKDMLFGENGRDLLTGGADSDVMTGGTESDRFIFVAGDFAGVNQNTPDRITDFSQTDRDRIDLSFVDARAATARDEAFTFIGAGPFSNVAGQLRFQQVAGNTFVFGDTNGDGVSDFTVQLDGLVTLAAKDFIL
jgi:Ca2+-binding RTX toxin-like protein